MIWTHLTYLAKIHGRLGWNAKPLTRGDLVSNLVSIFEAYLASLQNFARFKWNQSQITFPDFFREWRVVQTRPTELPLLKYEKFSKIFFLKVNFTITRYFCLSYKLRKNVVRLKRSLYYFLASDSYIYILKSIKKKLFKFMPKWQKITNSRLN